MGSVMNGLHIYLGNHKNLIQQDYTHTSLVPRLHPTYASRLISVGRRVGGAWGRG